MTLFVIFRNSTQFSFFIIGLLRSSSSIGPPINYLIFKSSFYKHHTHITRCCLLNDYERENVSYVCVVGWVQRGWMAVRASVLSSGTMFTRRTATCLCRRARRPFARPRTRLPSYAAYAWPSCRACVWTPRHCQTTPHPAQVAALILL